ncbi:Isoaspartyl peptidase/L-asparaginase [Holothuria leucospilota]|uniref:Isoaspartyl peptidase/L-asparaginase n=1 Tax=Holothuria leucospilota TaxID=206669 RepID=A0A9Q1HFN9_HOLLE|nr:Isoaspartyl peptidase/L-asparaginase [Holothuria leucospilota]
MEPAIIVHGGCGYITKESQKPQKLQQLKTAVVNGIRKMKDGGSSLDAVEIAVTVLEDSPLFNAVWARFLG